MQNATGIRVLFQRDGRVQPVDFPTVTDAARQLARSGGEGVVDVLKYTPQTLPDGERVAFTLLVDEFRAKVTRLGELRRRSQALIGERWNLSRKRDMLLGDLVEALFQEHPELTANDKAKEHLALNQRDDELEAEYWAVEENIRRLSRELSGEEEPPCPTS